MRGGADPLQHSLIMCRRVGPTTPLASWLGKPSKKFRRGFQIFGVPQPLGFPQMDSRVANGSGDGREPLSNPPEATRHLNRMCISWSQELTELWKLCNDLTSPKSSEIVL